MAITSYTRLRMLWGAFDVTVAQGQTPGYTSAQMTSGGDSAMAGSGIGVRRSTLVFDRSLYTPAQDQMTMHFDWLNFTAGAPDDTWITSDYTTCETQLQSFITSLVAVFDTKSRLTQIIWHRVGTGVSKPNPAERIFTLGTPIVGTATAGSKSAQTACSITFRTGVRRSWGRTYLPYQATLDANARVPTATVDLVANTTNTMVNSLASSDFGLVVVSAPLASSLAVEKVECDDIIDTIRRRRIRPTLYRKILP